MANIQPQILRNSILFKKKKTFIHHVNLFLLLIGTSSVLLTYLEASFLTLWLDCTGQASVDNRAAIVFLPSGACNFGGKSWFLPRQNATNLVPGVTKSA